ncbi:MAG: guanylate kinase [Candidatus Syntrophosphaera sp.]
MIKKDKSFLIILSAPSGGGKNAILNEVLKASPDIDYSVSYTTRAPRGNEKNGVIYHFVTEEEFLRRREEGDFLESAEVFGKWYGTSKSFVRSRLEAGHHVIMDIDVQGAAQITNTDVPNVKIFIMPPSMEVLRDRLKKRGTDSDEEIQKRLEIAREEVKQLLHYDYLVVNDLLETAVQDVLAIIRAEENRVSRYIRPSEGFLKQE